MSALLDQVARTALADALKKREAKERAEEEFSDSYVRFLRDARAAGWSWVRTGDALGLTGRACELYWKRNHMRAGRLGNAPVLETTTAPA